MFQKLSRASPAKLYMYRENDQYSIALFDRLTPINSHRPAVPNESREPKKDLKVHLAHIQIHPDGCHVESMSHKSS